MKHLKNCALGALLVAGFAGAAPAQDQPRPNTELQFKTPLTEIYAAAGSGRQAIGLGTQPVALAATSADKAPPATAGSETLYDLFLLAKSGDPELGRSRSRLLMSEAETDVARSALRPRVTADFGTSYIDQTTSNIGPRQNSKVTGYNYDVVASVPILHVSTYYNLASAKATARGEEAGVISANQNLINRLAQAYFAVLKAGGDQQIAREELSRVKQALEQAQAFLRAGTGDIIAVYEAQARLDSVVADLTRSENSLTIAEQTLSSIVGKVVSSIADHRLKQPMLPAPNDLEWWLATMEERDPQIRQAQENLAAVAQQTKSAKAEHLPVLDANAGFDDSKGAAFAPTAETRQWHVGAVVTLPLYSGGETSARVRRATASETERRYLLDQVRQQRRESVKQAFFNLRYNVSLIAALEQKEASALVQLNAVKKGRSIGTRTAIDLLNAEQAFSVAQRDLKNALYDNVTRVVELKAAAGVLSEEDIRY
jgi:outer membrane protein